MSGRGSGRPFYIIIILLIKRLIKWEHKTSKITSGRGGQGGRPFFKVDTGEKKKNKNVKTGERIIK